MSMIVSIICPTYNEEKYIASCINSILEQDFSQEKLEIIFVDGMSTDKTRIIIDQFIQKFPFIRLLDNPHTVVPHALNIGIRNAVGNVIIRIDAHCTYPCNYISTLVEYLYRLNADNVGGVCITIPAKETLKCQAIAIALSHIFGVGNSKFRIGVKEITQTDTVPFGCYRREIFEKIGFFDEELIRAEDWEFNARLILRGGRIYLIPNIEIKYFARDTIGKMTKMYYWYGMFKPLGNKKLGRPVTIRQFFPVSFVLGLLLGLLFSIFSKKILMVYLSIIFVYCLLCLIIGVKESVAQKKIGLIYFLPITFFLIHVSFGWGYIVGIYKMITKTKFYAGVTR